MLDALHIECFCLAQLIHVIIYLLIAYGRKLHDGGLPNPTGPLPILHHRPSCMQIAKSKAQTNENPCGMHIHNSLSNVAIHMPCVNMHLTGHYQLEMVFVLPTIPMGDDALLGSDCILTISVA